MPQNRIALNYPIILHKNYAAICKNRLKNCNNFAIAERIMKRSMCKCAKKSGLMHTMKVYKYILLCVSYIDQIYYMMYYIYIYI